MVQPLPANNPYLVGHEDAESYFLNAWKNNTLHHGFIISGLEGIGKATLAYRIARFLLSADETKKEAYTTLNVAQTNPVYMQIANGSNPNFMVLERDFTENDKKKIIKAIKEGEPLEKEDLADLKKSAVIKVDEVRGVNEFLSKTSFDGAWRIVLIDSVDDLNTASANAILKILEEPPAKSLLLLISHSPHKLLPTIQSRCAKIHLNPLKETEIASLLRRYEPDLNESQISGLAKICSGSIGKALNYAAYNGLDIYKKLESIILSGKRFDLSALIEIASKASADEPVWNLTLELLSKLLSDIIKSGEKVEELYPFCAEINAIDRDVTNLNMDKKHALYNLIYKITQVM